MTDDKEKQAVRNLRELEELRGTIEQFVQLDPKGFKQVLEALKRQNPETAYSQMIRLITDQFKGVSEHNQDMTKELAKLTDRVEGSTHTLYEALSTTQSKDAFDAMYSVAKHLLPEDQMAKVEELKHTQKYNRR